MSKSITAYFKDNRKDEMGLPKTIEVIISHIATVEAATLSSCTITLKDGSTYTVRQSKDEVLELIESN